LYQDLFEFVPQFKPRLAPTIGIGAHLTNDEKRAHLIDLKRDHLIDQVWVQEILPPDKK
jgi:hypothetical protein